MSAIVGSYVPGPKWMGVEPSSATGFLGAREYIGYLKFSDLDFFEYVIKYYSIFCSSRLSNNSLASTVKENSSLLRKVFPTTFDPFSNHVIMSSNHHQKKNKNMKTFLINFLTLNSLTFLILDFIS
ncbi:hypothetical protein BpHYR1_013673 [Brachionus plicatilis]|uniref:Uncharacterized protein n=1 Tax=Brachionus plicatilis TaxID=10195 RepID=A0A3M7SXD8_BRAPC|nr:hypothetical protein BpHYR1_013673 [Brachionus plicatilis]